MNVSLVVCHKMLKNANGDFNMAQKLIQQYLNEGGQRYNVSDNKASLKYGKVVADVNADGTIGILLSISCLSDAAAHSEIFGTLVDDILIVAFNEKPQTACQLLGTSIDCLKGTFNHDELLKKANDIEELVQAIRDKLREPIRIEDFLIMEVDKTQGSYYSITAYNHLDGKRASLCSFFTPLEIQQKDLEWLRRSVTANVAAYNPLCIHETTMPQSILNYITEKEKSELTLTVEKVIEGDVVVDKEDAKALQTMVNWKINGFLDEVVLDRLKVLSEPVQDLGPMEKRNTIPLKPVKEVCEMYGITPIDFECFQLKIVNTL